VIDRVHWNNLFSKHCVLTPHPTPINQYATTHQHTIPEYLSDEVLGILMSLTAGK